FVVFQEFSLVALPVEDVPVGGVLVGLVLGQVGVNVVLFRLRRASHQLVNVGTRRGDGQETNRAEDGVTATDPIRNDKGFVAVGVGLGLQRSLGLVGRGVNPLVSFFQAVLFNQLLLENPEGNGRFGRRP